MNQNNRPPLSIFGIRLRAILFVLVFLVVLLSLYNPHRLQQSFQGFLKNNEHQHDSTSPPAAVPDGEIVATPEMISKAVRQVHEEQARKYQSGQEAVVKVNYYLVNLADGGSIEAESISIKPDQVTVVTAQGVKTVIPRENITKIIQLKLDPKPSPESK